MKNKMKNAKGITLIALVVTIIVLIILAGISISLLLGDNGIITKAKVAGEVQEKAETKEKIQLELTEAQVGDTSIKQLTQTEIEEILAKYGTVNKENGNIISLTPTGKDYNIPFSEIYSGRISSTQPVVTVEWEFATNGDKDSSGTITPGDLVQPTNPTLANEKFWVIKVGTEVDPVVTLLAEKCVKTSSGEGQYTQMDRAGKLAFDSSSNVYYTNSTTYSSICGEVNNYVARFIGAGMHLQEVTNEEETGKISGLYGRLMYGHNDNGYLDCEAYRFKNSFNNSIVSGPDGNRISYWLSSSHLSGTNASTCMYWNGSSTDVRGKTVTDTLNYGLRPVVEVLQSKF